MSFAKGGGKLETQAPVLVMERPRRSLTSALHQTIIKKRRRNETSNFHYHGLKIRLGNHAKNC